MAGRGLSEEATFKLRPVGSRERGRVGLRPYGGLINWRERVEDRSRQWQIMCNKVDK